MSDGSSRPTLDTLRFWSKAGVRTTNEDDGKECDAQSRACYRSWTMRASYLSQDRCELQFAVKELARRMQQPNAKNMQALVYGGQAEQQVADVFSDKGCAGYAKTRRSTPSSFVMLGERLMFRQQQLKMW